MKGTTTKMSTSKSAAEKSANNSNAEEKVALVPSQLGLSDDAQDSGCTDEKVTALSKAKAFVVTNKKSLLTGVVLLASVALLKLAKAQKLTEVLVETEGQDAETSGSDGS